MHSHQWWRAWGEANRLCSERKSEPRSPACQAWRMLQCPSTLLMGFPGGSVVKNSPAMQETPIQFLGWEVPWRSDRLPTPVFLGFPRGSAGKESTCNAGDLVQSLGWEDPLEKGKATHSSILAWRIPWTEEPGGLQSMGSQRVGHDWATKPPPPCSFLYILFKAQRFFYLKLDFLGSNN